ncbi:MAG: hypothetical protein AB7V08_14095 [Elusimicrobiales bacterium]
MRLKYLAILTLMPFALGGCATTDLNLIMFHYPENVGGYDSAREERNQARQNFENLPDNEKTKLLPDILPYLDNRASLHWAVWALAQIPPSSIDATNKSLLCSKLLPNITNSDAPEALAIALRSCPDLKDDIVSQLSQVPYLNSQHIDALTEIGTPEALSIVSAYREKSEKESAQQAIYDKKEALVEALIHEVFAEEFAYGKQLQASRGIMGNLGGRISIDWQDDTATEAKVVVDFRGNAMMGGGIGTYYELMVTCANSKCTISKYLKDGAWVEGRLLTNHRHH